MEHDFITARIPHRPPFLWLDRILELGPEAIRAETFIDPGLPLFQGHYPEYPLMPGVLLCEAVFQAGALLIAEGLSVPVGGVPVLTRIQGARFKREVRPGDTVEIRARIVERLEPAWFLKGSVRLRDRLAVQVDFSCALKRENRAA